jgi:hypothetical protein
MGNGSIAPLFLSSTLDGGEWQASRPSRFIPGEIAPGIHWPGGWLCPKAGLGAVEKKKALSFLEIEHWSSSP